MLAACYLPAVQGEPIMASWEDYRIPMFKGIMSWDKYFIEGLYTSKTVLCTMYLTFLVFLVEGRKPNLKIVLAFMKLLTNSQICTESRIIISIMFSWLCLTWFSPALIGWRKNLPKITIAWSVYGTIFSITTGFRSKFFRNRRLPVCRNSLTKKVSIRTSD